MLGVCAGNGLGSVYPCTCIDLRSPVVLGTCNLTLSQRLDEEWAHTPARNVHPPSPWELVQYTHVPTRPRQTSGMPLSGRLDLRPLPPSSSIKFLPTPGFLCFNPTSSAQSLRHDLHSWATAFHNHEADPFATHRSLSPPNQSCAAPPKFRPKYEPPTSSLEPDQVRPDHDPGHVRLIPSTAIPASTRSIRFPVASSTRPWPL